MSKDDIVIAIRTAKRIDTIEEHTLKFIKDLGYEVYIFCPNFEIKEYRKKFHKEKYKIRDGGSEGTHLCNQKIVDCFPIGKKIVQMDDDIKGFYKYSTEEGKFIDADLKYYIEEGFKLCEENNFKLFGFYPVKNGYFMKGKEEYSKGLQFIMGGIHGFINDKGLRTVDNYRDDYERSILNYIKYGGSIRFNYVKCDNIIYVNQGGQAKLRTIEKMTNSCDYMTSTYPQYCRPKKCKSPYPEIAIKSKPYTIEHHLLANLRLMTWSKNCDRPSLSGIDEKRTRPERVVGVPCYSSTFGYLRPRRAKKGTLEITKISLKYPFVYHLLKEYIKEVNPEHEYSAICVNKNFKTLPHRDKFNSRLSLGVGLGDYTGGNLVFGDKEGNVSSKVNIHNNPTVFDGNLLHWNDDFKGERISLIYIYH